MLILVMGMQVSPLLIRVHILLQVYICYIGNI